MKHFLASILALLICQLTFSQVKTKAISGTVKDIQSESVAGATLKLLNASDSALVKEEITANNGKFQFDNLQNGNYLITITGVGFKKFTSASLTIDDAHTSIVLPVVILLPAKSTDLKG
ncbi:MAG: carboxypeptidase-like regulatory domain-containing protein, partial [Saprospiraceae bacterium]